MQLHTCYFLYMYISRLLYVLEVVSTNSLLKHLSITDQRDSENVSDNDLSSLSSDSEESHLTEIDEDEMAVVRLTWKPSGGPVCLGEWEQHTKVRNNPILLT